MLKALKVATESYLETTITRALIAFLITTSCHCSTHWCQLQHSAEMELVAAMPFSYEPLITTASCYLSNYCINLGQATPLVQECGSWKAFTDRLRRPRHRYLQHQ
jgi:hypothetical protein